MAFECLQMYDHLHRLQMLLFTDNKVQCSLSTSDDYLRYCYRKTGLTFRAHRQKQRKTIVRPSFPRHLFEKTYLDFDGILKLFLQKAQFTKTPFIAHCDGAH